MSWHSTVIVSQEIKIYVMNENEIYKHGFAERLWKNLAGRDLLHDLYGMDLGFPVGWLEYNKEPFFDVYIIPHFVLK